MAAGQATLAGSSKGEAGPDVFGLQVRKIAQQVRFGHSPGEVFEDVVDRDAGASDARFASANARRDDDAVFPRHGVTLRRAFRVRKRDTDAGMPVCCAKMNVQWPFAVSASVSGAAVQAARSRHNEG